MTSMSAAHLAVEYAPGAVRWGRMQQNRHLRVIKTPSELEGALAMKRRKIQSSLDDLLFA
jgi:hypothetical protein